MKKLYTVLLLSFAITSKAQLGTLIINSSEEGANVYLNGKLKGKTPLDLMVVPATYKIKISKDLNDFYVAEYNDIIKVENQKVNKIYPILQPILKNEAITKLTKVNINSAELSIQKHYDKLFLVGDFESEGNYLIDINGKVIIPSLGRKTYVVNWNNNKNYAIGQFTNDIQKTLVYDHNGNLLKTFVGYEIGAFNAQPDDYLILKNKNGYFITDENFNLIQIPNYDSNLNGIIRYSEYGFMDKKLNTILKPSERYTTSCVLHSDDDKFSNGLMHLCKYECSGNTKCGYISFSGQKIIDFKFAAVSAFHEDMAIVKLDNTDLVGAIDKSGNLVIEQKYYEIKPFYEGLAYFKKTRYSSSDGGYLDKQGNIIFSFSDGEGKQFSNGFAIISNNYSEKLINKQGKIVIAEGIFDFIDDYFQDGNLLVKSKIDKSYYLLKSSFLK